MSRAGRSRAAGTPAALALALAACHSGSDSDRGPVEETVVVNHALAVQHVYGSGELRLVAASEPDQGRDLDGDGDVEDLVLHLFDRRAGRTNTGLALALPVRLGDVVPPPPIGVSDAIAVFPVDELATGADMDRDGTVEELAHWTFDRRTGLLSTLPFVPEAVFVAGDLAAFLALDGPDLQARLHVLDTSAAASFVLPVTPAALLGIGDRVVAFTRAEAGALDLNADGDAIDPHVLHLFDVDSGRVENAGFEGLPVRVEFRAGFAGFNATEAHNGGIDLNGDGDAEDRVFVAVNGKNGLLRIAGAESASEAGASSPDAARFLLQASEGGRDRNGDGDGADPIGVVYDPVADRLHDSGLALAIPWLVEEGSWVALTVDEIGQGADLDGDGETLSNVPHVFEPASGERVNLGFEGQFLLRLDGRFLGVRFVRVDGALRSFELFSWEVESRSTRFAGVDVADLRAMDGDTAVLLVPESSADRNGDGDQDDVVLALYDGRTGAVQNLALAAAGFQAPPGSLEPGLVLVSEAAQGRTDLNGDGDADDLVLHEIVLAP